MHDFLHTRHTSAIGCSQILLWRWKCFTLDARLGLATKSRHRGYICVNLLDVRSQQASNMCLKLMWVSLIPLEFFLHGCRLFGTDSLKIALNLEVVCRETDNVTSESFLLLLVHACACGWFVQTCAPYNHKCFDVECECTTNECLCAKHG